VRHAVGGDDIDGKAQHFALAEGELGQVIDGLALGDLLEVQRVAAPDQVLDLAADAGVAGGAGLEHGNIHHALGLAAHQARGGGDLRLQKARVEGDVVYVQVAVTLLAFGQGRQAQTQGDKEEGEAVHKGAPEISDALATTGLLGERRSQSVGAADPVDTDLT
jgi:hypothetical protein